MCWDWEVGTGGIILDSVHQLDVSTMKWTTLETTVPDGPTSRHVVVSLPSGKEAVLHNHRCIDHVLIFKDEKFTKQETSGEAPSSRGLHSATMLDENNVLIFGGAAQNGQMSNEVFVLNVNTWIWNKILIDENAPLPTPRASPCIASVCDGCVIMFGGAEATVFGLKPRGDLWELNIDVEEGKGNWSLLVDDENGPPPRNAATLCEIFPSSETIDSSKKHYLLHGGWAPFKKTWSEPTVLRVDIEE